MRPATTRSARTASRRSQQQDTALGQVEYRCHNGQIVTRATRDVAERRGAEWWLPDGARRSSRRAPCSPRFGTTAATTAPSAPSRCSLIVWLAGIAFVLATATAAHLMDDSRLRRAPRRGLGVPRRRALRRRRLLVLRRAAARRREARSARRAPTAAARHLLAFAAVPVALSLVLWPVKLALYGDDALPPRRRRRGRRRQTSSRCSRPRSSLWALVPARARRAARCTAGAWAPRRRGGRGAGGARGRARSLL